jgi:hypothetical protein
MEVRMDPPVDEAAPAARPTRPGAGIGLVAEQTGREVERERRLADSRRTTEEDRMRNPAGDHRPDRGDGRGMTARPKHRTPVRGGIGVGNHGGVGVRRGRSPGQAGSAFFLVARRLGAGAASVSAGTPAVAPADAPLSSAVADAARRVVRRFGAAGSESTAGVVSATLPSAVAAAVRRVVRRFGASEASASAAPASATPASVTFDAADRVVRRRVAGFGDASLAASDAASLGSCASPAGTVGRDSRAGAAGRDLPDWASCARSISSSSGGTSLQGSPPDERTGRSERSGRSGRS